MSEEFTIDQNQPEEPSRKRITRRHLKSSPAPKMSAAGRKKTELSEVLSNLYENENEKSSLYEISVKKTSAPQRFAMLISGGVFIVAIIWAGFFFVSDKNNAGNNSGVKLFINGPTELSLGATTTFMISYENNSNATLEKVILNAYFPDGFIFHSSSVPANNPGHNEWDIGTILPYQKDSISITGLNYGTLDEKKSWRVFLNYLPTNFNSGLQKAATLTTMITAAPVKLTISGPDEVSVGADVIYTFNAQIDSLWDGTMFIAPELPPNFNITSSSPTLDKNGRWPILFSIPTANPLPASFSITGNYTGQGGGLAPMKGTILLSRTNGQYYQIGKAQLSSTLIKNDVAINLAINGSATDFNSRPGDTLNLTIRVKNQSQKPITNGIVKLFITAPSDRKVSLLNWAALVDKNDGVVIGEQIDDDTRRGIISWNSAQEPALSKLNPNDEVTIDLQLPIKDAKKFDLDTIKSPTITAYAETKYKDAAKTTESVSTHPIKLLLNSDLVFSNDDAVTGDGGAGKKHTINWVINNSFHALKNIVIAATAFGDVTFLPVDKAAGELTYDQAQGTIIWSIREMPTETDVLSSSFSLTLNKTNPTQNLLLSKAHLTAEDSVTGKIIDLAATEISL